MFASKWTDAITVRGSVSLSVSIYIFLGNGSESQKYIEIIGQWSLHFSKLVLDCWKCVSVCFSCRQMFQISTFYDHTKEMWVKTKSSLKVIVSFLYKRKLWKPKLDLWENIISCTTVEATSAIKHLGCLLSISESIIWLGRNFASHVFVELF